MKKLSALIAIAALATAVSAQASAPTSLLGNTVPDSTANRVVQISPSTKDLNVKWGQSVEFQSQGKSFTYDFNGPRADARVNLQRVAPAGVINHPVYAYVGSFPKNY